MEQELDNLVAYSVPLLDQGSVWHTVRVVKTLAVLHGILASRDDVVASLYRCGFRKVKPRGARRTYWAATAPVPAATAT